MIVYLELWNKNNRIIDNLLDYDGKGFIPSIDDIIIGNYDLSITNEKVFIHGKVFERLINHNSIIIRIKQF